MTDYPRSDLDLALSELRRALAEAFHADKIAAWIARLAWRTRNRIRALLSR